MLRVLILALMIFNSAHVSAQHILSEEIQYKKSIIKYFHAGAKIKINLQNIPYNTQEITIAPVNSGKRPKLYIIGKRRHKVKNDGSIEFTLELENLKPGSYSTKSSELDLTLYEYEADNKLVIAEKAQLFIRPIICADEGDGICGTVKTECHKGHRNCQEGFENRSFKNRCEMKKYDGIMLHAGPCKEI